MVTNSADGDSTSRTACTVPLTTRAVTQANASREKRGSAAAMSSTGVSGRSTAASRAVSPPSQTAMAATCTTVTVSARAGQGPATG